MRGRGWSWAAVAVLGLAVQMRARGDGSGSAGSGPSGVATPSAAGPAAVATTGSAGSGAGANGVSNSPAGAGSTGGANASGSSATAPVVAAGTGSPPATSVAATQASRPVFLCGVWSQPVASFGKWQQLGVNALVHYESEGGIVSRATWCTAARNAGLVYATESSGVAADGNDPALLFWVHTPDEPDGAGAKTPGQMLDAYLGLKHQNARTGVAISLDGWQMQWRAPVDYECYAKAADVLLEDYYPLNHDGDATKIVEIGKRIDQLRAAGHGKRVYAVLECCDQNLKVQAWVAGTALAGTMRGPTAQEMWQEAQVAAAHGAAGIIWFTDRIGLNFESYDGTTADQRQAMAGINAELCAEAKAGKLAGVAATGVK